MNRVAIYFFYDADGVVDQYNNLLLRDIGQYCNRLVVVCNGKLTPKGRKIFSDITLDVIVRENKGFDVWAYKTAIEWIGWNELRKYDELIMFNFTNFAPIYPFKYMFEKMDQQEVDFWGISIYHRVDPAPDWFEGKYIPEHLQSHFIAVRKSMLCSYEFRAYWENRPPIESYYAAISRHEAIFTEYFSQQGFRWKAYANTIANNMGTIYPALNYPKWMLQEYQYPFLKRRVFFHSYQSVLGATFGYTARDTLCYLEEETDYPTDVIWENILRTCNQYDVYHTLHLNKILPSRKTYLKERRCAALSIAVLIYLSDENCISWYKEYLKSFSQNVGVYLVCEQENVDWQTMLHGYINDPVRVIYNISHEKQAWELLSLLFEVSYKYDYMAVLHFNGKIMDNSRREAGYECAESLIATEEYVKNILQTFETNPRLGMLTVPRMYRGLFGGYYGKESKDYLQELKSLAMALNVPYETGKTPVSPYYGTFWCRGKAIQDIHQICGEKELKLLSTVPNRGIYQFVDCAWGLLAQAAGYYCGYAMCERLAEVEFTNLSYYLTTINRALNNSSIWNLQTIVNRLSVQGTSEKWTPAAAKDYQDGAVDFASIPRSVMVQQTIKKFCPDTLWKFLKRLFKKMEPNVARGEKLI